MQAYAGYKENGEYVPGTLRDSENQALGQLVAVTKLSQIKLARLGYYVAEVKLGVTLESSDASGEVLPVIEEGPAREAGPTVQDTDFQG